MHVEGIQVQAMHDQIASTYVKCMSTSAHNQTIQLVVPVVDTIDATIAQLRDLPYGLDFMKEIQAVDSLVFSSGTILFIEESIVRIGKQLPQPLPPMLMIESFKAHGVLIPWSNLLFYHVDKLDAIIRLQLVRNDLLYLACTTANADL